MVKSAQSSLITGLRGVGKTVILNEILRRAEAMGTIIPIYVEASENRGLAELLAAPLKLEFLKLDWPGQKRQRDEVCRF